MSENIFIKQDQENKNHAEKWGLQDLRNDEQMTISLKAKARIREEKITDEADMQKVYDDIKRQYLEYKAIKYPDCQ